MKFSGTFPAFIPAGNCSLPLEAGRYRALRDSTSKERGRQQNSNHHQLKPSTAFIITGSGDGFNWGAGGTHHGVNTGRKGRGFWQPSARTVVRQVPEEEWAGVWCTPEPELPARVWREEMQRQKRTVLKTRVRLNGCRFPGRQDRPQRVPVPGTPEVHQWMNGSSGDWVDHRVSLGVGENNVTCLP